MNKLSLWATVLLLGAMPLAAAAFDYGPNGGLLAVENGAPQLPDADAAGAVHAANPYDADAARDGGASLPAASPDSPAAQRTTPAGTSAPGRPGPTARSTPLPPSAGATPAGPTPHPAPWQSLLPGSIQ